MKREDLTYQDKLNELLLDVSRPNSFGFTFILVEGNTDIRLFRKLFTSTNCKIEDIPGGKGKMDFCLAEMLKRTSLTFGIKDSDFLKLGYKPYGKYNIFFTDFHDIEMIFVSIDKILSGILFEFTDLPESHHLSIREDIFKLLEEISLIKWLNEIEDLRLNFDSVGFTPLISDDNKIDVALYFSRLVGKSPNARITDVQIVLDKIQLLRTVNPNPFHLCNGHDFMKTLAFLIRRTGNTNSLSADLLESACRLKFDTELFKSTKLYKNTKKWSEVNNCVLYA